MIRLATVFSGIGAIEHALDRMGIEHEIVFACDNGDVDVLSKPIPCDIYEIEKELKELDTIIKSIKNENISEKNDFKDKLSDCKNKLENVKGLIENISNYDFVINLQNILKQILLNNDLKKTRKKEYESFSSLITNINGYEDKFNAISITLEILNDFQKDNDISRLDKNSNFKSTDNINWNEIITDLKTINNVSIKNQFKLIHNSLKETSEYVSMLHERINTLKIHNELSMIENYEEKKKYVDNLYKGKEEQNKVKKSYMANYKIADKDFHWNVSFFDGKQYENKVDLFVGGSPCQSFSLVGKQRGLEDTRGTLFYEYARLVSEIKPKVFIYENVKAVLSNDDGRTWEVMKKVFTDLNYTWKQTVLNAKDFGIPQNRERIFVVGFRNDLKLNKDFEFPLPVNLDKKMQDFLIDNVSGKYYLPKKGVAFVTDKNNLDKRYTQIDGEISLCQKKNQQFNWHGDFVFVEENKDMEKTMQDLEKYFLSEKVKKYVLSSGTKGFYSKPEIDLEIARPLLTTMHKMHRAGVDNYVTTEGRLRKLTPRECLRLMGFCDSFKIEVSDTSMYQQAGNSIVVDVLIAIMSKILESYDFNEEV